MLALFNDSLFLHKSLNGMTINWKGRGKCSGCTFKCLLCLACRIQGEVLRQTVSGMRSQRGPPKYGLEYHAPDPDVVGTLADSLCVPFLKTSVRCSLLLRCSTRSAMTKTKSVSVHHSVNTTQLFVPIQFKISVSTGSVFIPTFVLGLLKCLGISLKKDQKANRSTCYVLKEHAVTNNGQTTKSTVHFRSSQ
jgi:hypothetical protein